jgi:hypothetical protein
LEDIHFLKRLKPFFLVFSSARPQAALAIWRRAIEIGDSSSAIGVPELSVLRAVA